MAVADTLDELQVRLLRGDVQPPARSRPGDAGIDLRCVEGFELSSRQRLKVPTGIAVAFPTSVCGLIVPRSGLAANEGVAPVGGLIDPNFRGEICVTLINFGADTFTATAGDRIAQLLLLPFWAPALRLVEALPDSPDGRGMDGWGSSGMA
jgi:dUTP pyrophosphatase